MLDDLVLMGLQENTVCGYELFQSIVADIFSDKEMDRLMQDICLKRR